SAGVHTQPRPAQAVLAFGSQEQVEPTAKMVAVDQQRRVSRPRRPRGNAARQYRTARTPAGAEHREHPAVVRTGSLDDVGERGNQLTLALRKHRHLPYACGERPLPGLRLRGTVADE